jgi:hypothetical protein
MRLLAALAIIWAAGVGGAEPVFEIIRPDSVLGPGKTVPVWVRVRVKADSSIYQIRIVPSCPPGFVLAPDSGAAQPFTVNSLKDSNDLMVPFRLTVPGWSNGWNDLLVSAGRKDFALNYSYQAKGAGDPVHRSGSFSIIYAPSLFLYLVFGLAGILLGFYAKINIKNSQQIREISAERGGNGKVKQLARKTGVVIGATLPNLLTTLIMGLAVLLTMAKTGIPVEHCYFALPLGIGLALLADEELISKVNVK